MKIHGVENNLNGALVRIDKDNVDKFLDIIKKENVKVLRELKYSLERYFMEKFGGKGDGSNQEK